MQTEISEDRLRELATRAGQHSDDLPWLLEWYGGEFLAAHIAAPARPSLEVGTRAGGSALLWLLLMQELYGPDGMPPLFTVDPYGDRPYHDGRQKGRYYYGREYYAEQKQVLAPYANHVHFFMTSREFLTIATSKAFTLRYWSNGMPHPYRNFSWIYLDGEHDVTSVAAELAMIFGTEGFLAPGGRIAVDNVNWDPGMIAFLEESYDVEFNPQRISAIVRGVKPMSLQP